MKNKTNNINKDHVKRKLFIKNELKKIILKSIIQNLNIKPNLRALASKKISNIRIISSISRQNNNICLKSGRIKGVLKITQLSRHEMKKFCLNGCLQNVKTKAW